MSLITAVVTACLIGFLSPFVAVVSHTWVEKIRRDRAFKRLHAEPLIEEGVMLARLDLAGHYGPLMGRCKITQIEVGRMEVVSEDGKEVMSFTGREFEALHPVVEIK